MRETSCRKQNTLKAFDGIMRFSYCFVLLAFLLWFSVASCFHFSWIFCLVQSMTLNICKREG